MTVRQVLVNQQASAGIGSPACRESTGLRRITGGRRTRRPWRDSFKPRTFGARAHPLGHRPRRVHRCATLSFVAAPVLRPPPSLVHRRAPGQEEPTEWSAELGTEVGPRCKVLPCPAIVRPYGTGGAARFLTMALGSYRRVRTRHAGAARSISVTCQDACRASYVLTSRCLDQYVRTVVGHTAIGQWAA